MRTPLLYRLSLARAAAIFVLATPLSASAQSWPVRPVTMVVPFPAGGAPDIVARFLSESLGEKLGQRFVVENRTGASGNIGALSVARAAPDGYTIMMATPYPIGFNKLMSSDLKFDPEQDFVPIALIGKSPQILVSGPSLKAKNLKEVIAYAAANPGKLNVGIPGIGTTSHIALEYLLNVSNTKVTTVTYRGSPPPADIIGGQIDIGVGLVTGYVGMVNSGALHALVVTSQQRSEHLPDTPTAAESAFQISRRPHGTSWQRRPARRPTSSKRSMRRPMTTSAAKRARSSSSRSTCRPAAEVRKTPRLLLPAKSSSGGR